VDPSLVGGEDRDPDTGNGPSSAGGEADAHKKPQGKVSIALNSNDELYAEVRRRRRLVRRGVPRRAEVRATAPHR
jgi:hypothetical protein